MDDDAGSQARMTLILLSKQNTLPGPNSGSLETLNAEFCQLQRLSSQPQ